MEKHITSSHVIRYNKRYSYIHHNYNMRYKLITLLVISASVLGVAGLENKTAEAQNILTGNFSDTETKTKTADKADIEKVNWELEDGRTVTGMIIDKDLKKGAQNITITVTRTNESKKTTTTR